MVIVKHNGKIVAMFQGSKALKKAERWVWEKLGEGSQAKYEIKKL